jgi:glutaredoxin-like protein
VLREEEKQEIQNRLKQMREPVSLVYFTQQLIGTCQFCLETERILKDVVPLSEKLSLHIKNFVSDREDVKKFSVDKIPAICFMEKKDHGLLMYGIPSGYEFLTFLETIIRLSLRDSGLSAESKESLKALKKQVRIQVFVTPTCPYCPRAVTTGFQLAQESDFITCDVVEISEFPHLAQKYGVMGIPKTVLNENYGFDGALPERLFIEQVLRVGQ